jgi:hypothetical protein
MNPHCLLLSSPSDFLGEWPGQALSLRLHPSASPMPSRSPMMGHDSAGFPVAPRAPRGRGLAARLRREAEAAEAVAAMTRGLSPGAAPMGCPELQDTPACFHTFAGLVSPQLLELGVEEELDEGPEDSELFKLEGDQPFKPQWPPVAVPAGLWLGSPSGSGHPSSQPRPQALPSSAQPLVTLPVAGEPLLPVIPPRGRGVKTARPALATQADQGSGPGTAKHARVHPPLASREPEGVRVDGVRWQPQAAGVSPAAPVGPSGTTRPEVGPQGSPLEAFLHNSLGMPWSSSPSGYPATVGSPVHFRAMLGAHLGPGIAAAPGAGRGLELGVTTMTPDVSLQVGTSYCPWQPAGYAGLPRVSPLEGAGPALGPQRPTATGAAAPALPEGGLQAGAQVGRDLGSGPGAPGAQAHPQDQEPRHRDGAAGSLDTHAQDLMTEDVAGLGEPGCVSLWLPENGAAYQIMPHWDEGTQLKGLGSTVARAGKGHQRPQGEVGGGLELALHLAGAMEPCHKRARTTSVASTVSGAEERSPINSPVALGPGDGVGDGSPTPLGPTRAWAGVTGGEEGPGAGPHPGPSPGIGRRVLPVVDIVPMHGGAQQGGAPHPPPLPPGPPGRMGRTGPTASKAPEVEWWLGWDAEGGPGGAGSWVTTMGPNGPGLDPRDGAGGAGGSGPSPGTRRCSGGRIVAGLDDAASVGTEGPAAPWHLSLHWADGTCTGPGWALDATGGTHDSTDCGSAAVGSRCGERALRRSAGTGIGSGGGSCEQQARGWLPDRGAGGARPEALQVWEGSGPGMGCANALPAGGCGAASAPAALRSARGALRSAVEWWMRDLAPLHHTQADVLVSPGEPVASGHGAM